ncbi:unnamed protein product [Gordionus sp. m RMFG-2023]
MQFDEETSHTKGSYTFYKSFRYATDPSLANFDKSDVDQKGTTPKTEDISNQFRRIRVKEYLFLSLQPSKDHKIESRADSSGTYLIQLQLLWKCRDTQYHPKVNPLNDAADNNINKTTGNADDVVNPDLKCVKKRGRPRKEQNTSENMKDTLDHVSNENFETTDKILKNIKDVKDRVGCFASLKLYMLPQHLPRSQDPDSHFGEDELIQLSRNIILPFDQFIEGIQNYNKIYVASNNKIVPQTHNPYLSLNPFHHNYTPLNDHNYKDITITDHNGAGDRDLNSLFYGKLCILSYPAYIRCKSQIKRLETIEKFTCLRSLAEQERVGNIDVQLTRDIRYMFCKTVFGDEDESFFNSLNLRSYSGPIFRGRPKKEKPADDQETSKNSPLHDGKPTSVLFKSPPISPSLKQYLKNFSKKNSYLRLAKLNKRYYKKHKLNITNNDNVRINGWPNSSYSAASKCALDYHIRQAKLESDSEKLNFFDSLKKFMCDRGTPLKKIPHLGPCPVDLYQFYKIVKINGGYKEVRSRRIWKKLYNKMGGFTHNTSAATSTRRHYENLLLPYEMYERSLLNPQKSVIPSLTTQCSVTLSPHKIKADLEHDGTSYDNYENRNNENEDVYHKKKEYQDLAADKTFIFSSNINSKDGLVQSNNHSYVYNYQNFDNEVNEVKIVKKRGRPKLLPHNPIKIAQKIKPYHTSVYKYESWDYFGNKKEGHLNYEKLHGGSTNSEERISGLNKVERDAKSNETINDMAKIIKEEFNGDECEKLMSFNMFNTKETDTKLIGDDSSESAERLDGNMDTQTKSEFSSLCHSLNPNKANAPTTNDHTIDKEVSHPEYNRMHPKHVEQSNYMTVPKIISPITSLCRGTLSDNPPYYSSSTIQKGSKKRGRPLGRKNGVPLASETACNSLNSFANFPKSKSNESNESLPHDCTKNEYHVSKTEIMVRKRGRPPKSIFARSNIDAAKLGPNEDFDIINNYVDDKNYNKLFEAMIKNQDLLTEFPLSHFDDKEYPSNGAYHLRKKNHCDRNDESMTKLENDHNTSQGQSLHFYDNGYPSTNTPPLSKTLHIYNPINNCHTAYNNPVYMVSPKAWSPSCRPSIPPFFPPPLIQSHMPLSPPIFPETFPPFLSLPSNHKQLFAAFERFIMRQNPCLLDAKNVHQCNEEIGAKVNNEPNFYMNMDYVDRKNGDINYDREKAIKHCKLDKNLNENENKINLVKSPPDKYEKLSYYPPFSLSSFPNHVSPVRLNGSTRRTYHYHPLKKSQDHKITQCGKETNYDETYEKMDNHKFNFDESERDVHIERDFPALSGVSRPNFYNHFEDPKLGTFSKRLLKFEGNNRCQKIYSPTFDLSDEKLNFPPFAYNPLSNRCLANEKSFISGFETNKTLNSTRQLLSDEIEGGFGDHPRSEVIMDRDEKFKLALKAYRYAMEKHYEAYMDLWKMKEN